MSDRDSRWMTGLSKFLALALRHRPQAFGLEPDGDGYVPLADMMGVVQSHRRYGDATEADLRKVVGSSDKQRYEIVDREPPVIRARYGHSWKRVDYQPATPPARLLHGTGSAALGAIRQHGLKPMSRHYVHLTPNGDMAEVVGHRHTGDFVMLTIRADELHAAGHAFYQAAPEIWLVDSVPPDFIEFPPQ